MLELASGYLTENYGRMPSYLTEKLWKNAHRNRWFPMTTRYGEVVKSQGVCHYVIMLIGVFMKVIVNLCKLRFFVTQQWNLGVIFLRWTEGTDHAGSKCAMFFFANLGWVISYCNHKMGVPENVVHPKMVFFLTGKMRNLGTLGGTLSSYLL